MAVPADEVPVERLLLVPFAELPELVAHEVELLARVRVLESVGEAEVRELLPVVAGHLAQHGALAVHHFVVAEHLDEVLAVGVHHAERELVVVVLAVDGFVLDVAQEVVHPAHVPLVVETEAALLGRARDAGEARGFLGDEDGVRREAAHDAVQVLQELDGVVVDVAAVLVRDPFARALAVVEVEHGGDRVYAEAVAVEFLEPVHRVRDEEVLDFVAAQVEDVGAPVRVFALARVGVLVAGGAVKAAERMGVLGKVRGDPVEDYADFGLVAQVHEMPELVGGAVAARGGVVARHLVAPGLVERVFRERQEFHVGVAHFLEVGDESFGEFVPVEETVGVGRVAAPGTGVDFVDVHGRAENLGCPVRLHVEVVAPFVAVEVRGDGGGCRAHFAEFRERVHFHVEVAVGAVDFETVEFAFTEVRDEDFPDAGTAEHAHLVAASVPAVETANNGNGLGVGGPDGELHAFETLVFHEVCAELAVEFVVRARGDEVPVEFGEDRLECVRIGEFVLIAVVLLDDKVVEERLEFGVEDGLEEACVTELDEIELNFSVDGFTADESRLRLVRAYGGLDATIRLERVNTQYVERVFAVKVPDGEHLLPSQACKIGPFHTALSLVCFFVENINIFT